jgi:ubiquinone/menaquinone biosynthesis C-methylase UbiE
MSFVRAILVTLAWTAGTLVAIIAWRRLVPAPMPRAFDFILNTKFRRRTFSPEMAAERHGLGAGMRVLEVGPAGGYLTAAAAQRIQPGGQLVSLDLQHAFLRALRTRLEGATPALVCADAACLPFRDGCFDAVFVADVMGEIPDKRRAVGEFGRVLRAAGTLAVSEAALFDPDYVRAPVLQRLVTTAGFEPRERFEEWFQYTHRFTKPVTS